MKMIIFLLLLTTNIYAQFDQTHSKLTKILKTYTKQSGHQTLVNYKFLKSNHQELKNYLNDLENLKRSEFKNFSNGQKLVFWINAYNAYTLELIVKNYPLKSIKDLGGSFLFGTSPWKQKFIPLFGKTLHLDNIEHDIIRKNFKEPRIHFAVNCASIGCPSILREAFVAEKLEQQLDIAADNFLANKNKNFNKKNTLHLSKIFKWYGGDFDKKYGGYKNFVKKHYGISEKVDVEVNFNDYDWQLNEYH